MTIGYLEIEYDERQFTSYSHWINKGSAWLLSDRHNKYVCVAADGKICRSGADFKDAAYPVRFGQIVCGNDRVEEEDDEVRLHRLECERNQSELIQRLESSLIVYAHLSMAYDHVVELAKGLINLHNKGVSSIKLPDHGKTNLQRALEWVEKEKQKAEQLAIDELLGDSSVMTFDITCGDTSLISHQEYLALQKIAKTVSLLCGQGCCPDHDRQVVDLLLKLTKRFNEVASIVESNRHKLTQLQQPGLLQPPLQPQQPLQPITPEMTEDQIIRQLAIQRDTWKHRWQSLSVASAEQVASIIDEKRKIETELGNLRHRAAYQSQFIAWLREYALHTHNCNTEVCSCGLTELQEKLNAIDKHDFPLPDRLNLLAEEAAKKLVTISSSSDRHHMVMLINPIHRNGFVAKSFDKKAHAEHYAGLLWTVLADIIADACIVENTRTIVAFNRLLDEEIAGRLGNEKSEKHEQ